MVEWRTRKRGTPRQIGTRFPIPEGSKRDLPSGLKVVFTINEKERENRRLELLKARLKNLAKEVENDLIQGLPVEHKILEMNKIAQEIEETKETKPTKNGDPYSFDNIIERLKKFYYEATEQEGE